MALGTLNSNKRFRLNYLTNKIQNGVKITAKTAAES